MATAGPFYDTMPGPERRDALNQMWATWQAAFENAAGEKGWSPLLRAVVDGDRLVMELHDWTGGEGDKPTQRGYLGAAGYVPGIADALDFRGPRGLQGIQGPTGATTIDGIVGLQTALDAKLDDAPLDGKQYARKGGAWAEILTTSAVGYQEFTSSQTWAKPAGANCFYVEVLSGGGSGAATFGNTSWVNAEGGAGGVLRRTVMLASALGSSIGIIVGSGGAAVSANSPANTVGNAGGDSSFDSFVSPGGLGGKANSTSPNVPLSWSGITIAAMSFENYASGGNAAAGGRSFDGGGGGGGAGSGSNPTPAGGTSKTAGAGGAGARGGASGANAAGGAGSAPGGGGGAAAVYGGLAVATSGAGAAGRVRVWWW